MTSLSGVNEFLLISCICFPNFQIFCKYGWCYNVYSYIRTSVKKVRFKLHNKNKNWLLPGDKVTHLSPIQKNKRKKNKCTFNILTTATPENTQQKNITKHQVFTFLFTLDGVFSSETPEKGVNATLYVIYFGCREQDTVTLLNLCNHQQITTPFLAFLKEK